MKIAIAGEGSVVSEHFGHCTNFLIFDVENGTVVGEESVANPGHRPGFLPNFLADRGVNVIISGGMGEGAVELFGQRGVAVVTGAAGEARAAAESYARGELQSGGDVCHEHLHHDHCDG